MAWLVSKALSKKKKRPVYNADSEKMIVKGRRRRGRKIPAGKMRLKKLEVKHGKLYTPMPFKIGAEMNVGGVHISLDDPPSSTLFN